MGKIIRIGKPQTLEKYEAGIRKAIPYHIRKSKSGDTVDSIMNTFKEGLNRLDKLNGVIIDDDGKVTGFFISRLDTEFFSNIDSQQNLPIIFIEHLYCPNSIIEPLYKSIRKKFREEAGATDLFMFTHRDPEAWIRFKEKFDGEHFEIYGYILVDRLKED